MYKILRILITLLLISSSIYADLGTTGKIAGQVTDAVTGEPIPFVNVIVMGTSYGAASDFDGYYSIINIPPGIYEVKGSAIGFNPMTVTNVKVSIDLTTTIDLQLNETSVQLEEEVIVVATRPLVVKDLTASTAIVGADLIKELPVNDLNDVLQLQAGIVVAPGGDIHVRGGRSGQVTYQIDGVPVTDAYDGSTVVEVNQNAVQEMQVISGAFNAEYGQALSAIVNVVTKDGSNDFNGNIQMFAGDYVSDKTDIFWNVNDVNPISIANIEGGFSGPIINDDLFFYVNLRYYKNAGYLYGRRDYLVTDVASEVPNSGGADFNITQNGDGEFVSLNPFEKYFGQGKLTYVVMPGMRLSYNLIYDKQNLQYYEDDDDKPVKVTPDNNLQRFNTAFTNILNLNHAISSSSFYTLNLSYFSKRFEQYLFEDIYTGNPDKPTEYVDNTIHQTPPFSYNVGGTNMQRFERETKSFIAKLDWTTQVTHTTNLQFGISYIKQDIFFHDINLVDMRDENGLKVFPYNVVVPPIESVDNNQYNHKPTEFATYLQAKFEAFNMIINVGLRWDLFAPDGVVLADPSDPNIKNPLRPSHQADSFEERLTYWYEDATVKTQLSPRLGIAFPITDQGVIHFSYGHFFQLPRYEFLYENPEFELGVGSGNQGLFGNANLLPQKTVKGEIGLQQQIGAFSAIDVTVFFEDYRDLTGTQTESISVFGGAQSYSVYANSDFGFSRGFIIKYTQRFGGGVAVNIDYTFSDTKGNSSNPEDSRNAVQDGALPETIIAPLNWDQSHTLNISIAYAKSRDWGFSMIGNFFSGQPYTPAVNKFTRVTQNAFPTNSDNKPFIANIDLRVYKDFPIGNQTLSAFIRIFNLLDYDNAVNVYTNTGDPYYTIDKTEAERINPTVYNSTLDDYYNVPTYFSQPRRVELGVAYNF